MEFACSHVVCNWRPEGAGAARSWPDSDYRVAVKLHNDDAPPPLPPRRLKKPKPSSLPPPLPPSSGPPPVPPRLDKQEAAGSLSANVNVVSLSVGKMVDVGGDSAPETSVSPVLCGKCGAALSCVSSVVRNVWPCEFCGSRNGVDGGACRAGGGRRRGDDLYLPVQSDNDYQNLEDTMVVFCVDISGSMSVTAEVTSDGGSAVYKSRLEGVQDALQRALSSMLQQTPHRRVALVTFNDEVVLYGDGTRTPLTLRDWALVDYDHIWQQGVSYSVPHCIAETFPHLARRVSELREHGATSLGPAALASVAMASRYPGSKVVLCTDGKANIGLGEMEQTTSPSPLTNYFYKQLALQALDRGVIISVMSFEGTDCRLADIGRLADTTGGKVNIVSIGTVATEIQSISVDNVLATGVKATVISAEGVYFPYEDQDSHRLEREIGNVTSGLEITFQFAVKPQFVNDFLQRDQLPFQVQLSFKTRDQERVTRVITEQRPVTVSSQIQANRLNMAVLGVHCAQLCASLTMNGRVQEAQKQLKAHQDLMEQVSKLRPMEKEESIYSNWMDTMTIICDDINTESQTLSDEAAKVVYQMKRARSVNYSNKTAMGRKT
ncbi:circularly permutated Ras protein 1 [Salarias fasciatus]|uniref:Circularly permutated Ras protein 1-like n=1 Tax=Salarias fasciatus TaxID=181472 RepID=A0A672JCR9_SALFA|nr:circularly permutated Ras protein 1-like [Salarias fasciatus]XP_029943935.1 circularly permutated Ras protein 1-like [Salarias fasciatus]